MTMTIEMTPEVETGLERKARRCGQPLSDYVRDLLERDAETEAEQIQAQPSALTGTEALSPLAVALALARELGPSVRAGTRRPIIAADEIEANREERMQELVNRP
ncbi:MAG: hypothetical protein M3Y28_10370 [Armatimonadota bacterium]|nr:hypothetical protein [Armatimonadota bacterium]